MSGEREHESHDEVLHEYLDGTLSEGERAELEARLATDGALAEELVALRSVIAAAQDLPPSIAPPRDLWPGIEKRIQEQKVVRFPTRRLLAAAAAILIFVAGIYTGVLRDQQSTQRAEAPPTGTMLLDRVEEEYTMASTDVLERLSGREDELDPATVELIRNNLEIIDEAIREIRVALDEDPDNPRLNRLLTGEYRRRGALLRHAAGVADAI